MMTAVCGHTCLTHWSLQHQTRRSMNKTGLIACCCSSPKLINKRIPAMRSDKQAKGRTINASVAPIQHQVHNVQRKQTTTNHGFTGRRNGHGSFTAVVVSTDIRHNDVGEDREPGELVETSKEFFCIRVLQKETKRQRRSGKRAISLTKDLIIWLTYYPPLQQYNQRTEKKIRTNHMYPYKFAIWQKQQTAWKKRSNEMTPDLKKVNKRTLKKRLTSSK